MRGVLSILELDNSQNENFIGDILKFENNVGGIHPQYESDEFSVR